MKGSIRIWTDRKPIRVLMTESPFTRTPETTTDSTVSLTGETAGQLATVVVVNVPLP